MFKNTGSDPVKWQDLVRNGTAQIKLKDSSTVRNYILYTVPGIKEYHAD